LGAEPTQGFVAYATPSLLFVKTFVDVPASSVVDSEAPIELYVKPESYVEIEQQSAATLLGPGQRLSYRLSWFLRTMRPDINVTSMNEQLLAFTRQVGDLPE
jgi:hypothetical protein